MYWIRIAAATTLAAGIGFLIHVLYGQGIAIEYVQKAAEAGRLNGVIMPPYPKWVVFIASFTALMPALGKVLIYTLIQDKIPGRNIIFKGAIFGLLLLFVGDDLLRMPIMSIATGNPFDVMFVQSLEKWIIYPAMGIIIAVLAPKEILKNS